MIRLQEADQYIPKTLFSTLTNVNFDPGYFVNAIQEICRFRDEYKSMIEDMGHDSALEAGPATFEPPKDEEHLLMEAQKHGLKDYPTQDDDIRSLMHTVLYGLKGISAYTDHAQILGKTSPEIYDFLHDALSAGWDGKQRSLADWIELAMKAGQTNIQAMALLDAANTETYGHPEPTKVPLGHKRGKCIVVSGHDLKDLDMLLQQTEGRGITVYTHGEMLPCHGYPGLKKYPHLYGNYGTAWLNQQREFSDFPGAVLMTTNCLQRPQQVYEKNIFTTGLVGWAGVTHIAQQPGGWKDFSPVIDRALELPGWAEDKDKGSVYVGFARNAVLSHAGKIIDLVKAGKIRHFFLVGGCDGAKPGRSYFTRFVEQVPADCMVLTLACGKYRFFDKDLGQIDGLPRLLDVGQCNDSYSAVQIALALATAFDTDVNHLPLSLIISWYEQKAVAILLSLLHLGIQNIYLGPSLPAFLTPNVLNYLVEKYHVQPISTPEEDLKQILG